MTQRRPPGVWIAVAVEGAISALAAFIAIGWVVLSFSALAKEGTEALLPGLLFGVPIWWWTLTIARRGFGSCERIWSAQASPWSIVSLEMSSPFCFAVCIAGLFGLSFVAVAQFERVAERGRASEAISYLRKLALAQDEHRKKHGRFSGQPERLGLEPTKFFRLELSVGSAPPSWRASLRRLDAGLSPGALKRYGRYAIVARSQPPPEHSIGQTLDLACEGGADPRRCRNELLP